MKLIRCKVNTKTFTKWNEHIYLLINFNIVTSNFIYNNKGASEQVTLQLDTSILFSRVNSCTSLNFLDKIHVFIFLVSN